MSNSDQGSPSLNLKIVRDGSKSELRQHCEAVLDPTAGSAFTAVTFSTFAWGETDITEAVEVLRDKAAMVHGGDLKGLETTLVAHTAALDAIFAEMSRRALLNMGTNIEVTERYMRLALKAQGQCRATIESLSLIKNPPVYAKQANINHGGQQQVNNGSQPHPERSAPTCTPVHTGGEKSDFQQTKLLEQSHGQRMDTRKTRKASRGNQALEAVGAVHGAGHGPR